MSTSPAVVSVLRFILLLVFVGWLIIWIVLPTKTFRDSWRPNLQDHLTSTYFGDQGVNLVLFSFPVIFIAALSCVHLHLIQTRKSNKVSYSTYYSTSFASFWRRPASVKAPLGIVTAMELGFAVMFVALLVWSLTNYIHVGFAHLHNMHMKPIPGLKEWEAKLRSVSYRLGLTGNICLAFLFFPVTRGSSILAMFGLTSESSIKYHIWLGHLSMVLFAAHSLGYIIFWGITHQMAQMLEWSNSHVSNVAGEIAIICAMAMWVTSIPRARQKMFELFFYTHQLYVLYIVFYILHARVSFFCTILPGIFLFIIDRYLRFLQSYQRAELVSARILPCETIELNFSKSQGLDYNPTSILFINVPSVSKMQWHPFTVTSNSHMEADKLSVVIKSLGSWSQKLYQQLSSNSVDHIQVSVEGPYGPTSLHFLRHKALVMISGGSGITPIISIIREIIFQSTKPDSHVPPVRLICAFKNSADLAMLQLLLPISVTPFNFTKLQLQIEAYVTRETQQQPPSDPHKLLQTLWFKPDPLDSPITSVLGQNTWLWLGAIISSSFFLFLFVLGIVNHFYIYPIDHNTGEHYHVSFICLWYIFLVCASIFIVSSAIFIWCKKQNAIEEGKRNQNAKLSTPATDIELQSSPHNHESLIAQATQVQYGTRPDLKKILLETKGSNIGVLVCGPRKMRHEVATVCSSSLAHNLQFESISFNCGVMKSLWKRPVLVKGPLGIVSWIELSFLAMFIALLVWSISSYLHGMFATISLQAAAKREHVWQAKLESTALMLGLVGNICLAFLFFPVARGSSILQLVGLTSEASIKYHIWLGHLVMTIFTAHGLCYIIFWACTSQISQMLKWEKIGISNVAGEVALLAGLAMWATSFPRIRRKIFELFFYTHHLYIVFIVFFVFHVGFSYACIMLPGFYLFMIDRLLRFLQSQQRIRIVSARVLPCEAVELSFSKIPGLSYSPTSMMFLNVPAISKLQWHPFTITSSSNMDPDNLSVVVKRDGSWTRNLYQKFASSSTCPMDRLEVSVEGPYGPASNNLLRHDTIVMVSGGSGITPMISIIRELLSQANDSGKKTPQVLLITAFKKSVDLTMLDLILPPSGTNLDISCLQLQIEAYVTRENQPATHNQKPLQTIWFKPDPLDSPVSAVLGRNSWLSLGVIISMSFIIFLVLMGILTRYYIYPIDHNSNLIYSASYRSALNMLLLCVSIATTATAVFLWNKKQNSKETGQIQSIDTPPQITTSPSARFYNADRELESVPHQSFVQSTKVHYGTRPDLQKILWDCEGSSIGVLVSGPRKMRQEVAVVCSSPSAHNLHYHSMSFSW